MTPGGGNGEEPSAGGVKKDPVFQTAVIVLGNFFFVVVVVIVLVTGYEKHPPIPWLFFGLEFLVIAGGLVSVGLEYLGKLLGGMGGLEDDYKPGPLMRKWVESSPQLQGPIVFGLTGLVMAAVTSLVVFTGLAIESPFVPMAAAPAVFGPFVAGNPKTVRSLVLVVIAILAAIALFAPRSECGLRDCAGDPAQYHPRRFVFWLVTTAFLGIAGYISTLRLRREHNLLIKQETLVRQKQQLGETLTREKEQLEKRLTREKQQLEESLTREKQQLEDMLSREVLQLATENRALTQEIARLRGS